MKITVKNYDPSKVCISKPVLGVLKWIKTNEKIGEEHYIRTSTTGKLSIEGAILKVEIEPEKIAKEKSGKGKAKGKAKGKTENTKFSKKEKFGYKILSPKIPHLENLVFTEEQAKIIVWQIVAERIRYCNDHVLADYSK